MRRKTWQREICWFSRYLKSKVSLKKDPWEPFSSVEHGADRGTFLQKLPRSLTGCFEHRDEVGDSLSEENAGTERVRVREARGEVGWEFGSGEAMEKSSCPSP